jgi:TPR repeat protein
MTAEDSEHLAAQAIEAGAYEEAVRLLRPLAEGNSEYALLSLGWLCETGAMGVSDKETARLYYERAASHGSASANLYLGCLHLSNGDEMQARTAFERGAELDNADCKSALARLASRGAEQLAARAIENQAYEEAIRLLRPLAESNSEYALLSLGWLYETGAVGDPDREAARLHYKRAADNGSAPACFELGRLLSRQGEEVQARLAFETGAERGDVPSMSRLGRMMVEGRGGPTDSRAGSAWLEKAAAEGHILAQRTLLGIEERNAQSVFEKLSVKMKIASLAKKGAGEMLKDPSSDKVR